MTAVERLLFDGADPARPPLRGNRGDYYDAENSLVDAILERRLGIPISIASVFVAVCVRAGVATTPSRRERAGPLPVWNSNLQPDFNRRGLHRHNGLSLAPRSSLDAALRSRPTPADVCRRALRNLAAIYDDDPCGSLVTCSLAAALEDAPGAAAISPLTAAIRCKLALADGGYDRGATHDRDRVLVLAGSLRRDLDAVGADGGGVPADQRRAGRVAARAPRPRTRPRRDAESDRCEPTMGLFGKRAPAVDPDAHIGKTSAEILALPQLQIQFLLSFIWMASYGDYLWLFDEALADPGFDRIWGYHGGAEKIVISMLAIQSYDVPVSLIVPDLRQITFVLHHAVVLTLAWIAMRYQAFYFYGVYFLGVIESSSPFLAAVDAFRDFPKLAERWPNTNEACRITFAVVFYIVRIVGWVPVSKMFWLDALSLLEEGAALHTMPRWVPAFWLLTHAGLSCLQAWWGFLILKALWALVTGDESARANEAKSA
ncbi:glycosyltransferase [Aureococcus anophagefferens]|nr:glycosyltransferase [Aureococcus anophagefferens]